MARSSRLRTGFAKRKLDFSKLGRIRSRRRVRRLESRRMLAAADPADGVGRLGKTDEQARQDKAERFQRDPATLAIRSLR